MCGGYGLSGPETDARGAAMQVGIESHQREESARMTRILKQGPRIMSKYESLSQEYLLSVLRYDKNTGDFIWRERTPDMFEDGKQTKENNCKAWNARYANTLAGHADKKEGRRIIKIKNKAYCANVLAWIYETGEIPKTDIDHIDNNPNNDAFSNLRLATRSENLANKRKTKSNRSGYKGVHYMPLNKKFRATIRKQGKHYSLGLFETAQQAHEAYCKAAQELFGEFARFE